MTDSSDLYEYRLKTVDSSDGLFMLAALVISALFSTGLITVLLPSNLYNNMPVVVYAIICGLCTMFIWFGFIPFLPASNPERFYFGQRGFRFESSLYSSTASFYRPADKVHRISHVPPAEGAVQPAKRTRAGGVFSARKGLAVRTSSLKVQIYKIKPVVQFSAVWRGWSRFLCVGFLGVL